ncbi:MAG: OsmC family protein, partial [Akkermansiaceae bacterium]|nr:OsmC family protein [Akkermansiaceae bacterium]
MVEIEINYEGQLRCGAEHGPSKDTLKTDAPVDNHGRGEAFSPTDLVATALGSCMLTIMGIVAQRDGIPLEGSRARVVKHMSTDTPRRIAKLE